MDKSTQNNMENLKCIIDWAFFSLIPLTVLTLVFGILSDSLTVLTITVDSGLSLIVNFFAFFTIRKILNQNVFTFPYGTGKLENFTSFLYGALLIPSSFFIIYFAISRLITPPEFISFGLTQVPLIPQLLRSLIFFAWSYNLLKKEKNPSPMVHSYYINFKVCTMADLGVTAALITAFVLNYMKMKTVAYSIDPILSLIIAVYMLYNGFSLIKSNFKSIINLPLPEEDQLKIMKVLTTHFDLYDNIGHIYTQRSGKTRFIEFELEMKPTMNINEIMKVKDLFETELKKQFNDIRFSILLIKPDSTL
jgi:ferrous-iron efflux pump FieF